MLVKIKPIDKKKWHGKSGKESFSQPVGIRALYSSDTGTYATGLSEKKRKELEGKTNFNLSPIFNPNLPHEFWDSRAAILILQNNTIILDTKIPLDEIKMYIARSSKLIANSVSELDEGLFPEATHVIYDEEEEITVKAKRVELIQKAYERLSSMTKNDKINIILIIAGKNTKHQSTDYIEVEMDKIITKKTEMFLKYIEMSKEKLKSRAFVLEAILSGVLTKRSSGIFYMDELIGGTVDDAIDYLNDNKNQNLKVIILDKLT